MINVTKTYLPDKNIYMKYIDKIYETGWVTNNGQFAKQLEKELKDYLGVRNIILVSNGTLALQVAYKLLNLSDGVITTPFSFVATTSSMVWEGLKPVFVDINKDSFNIDCAEIESKISNTISAIVPVHVFGNGCDVEEIQKISRKHNLKVIYDAAHAFGVKYKEKSILNYGDISILSFHATKVFHTIEGGALIINNDDLYERAKLMINFGIKGPEKIDELGINAKMNEFQAAMGLCMLNSMDEIFKNRKAVYEIYANAFYNRNDVKLQIHNLNCNYNYSYFPIVFETEEKLLKVKRTLEKNNIYARRYFYPSLDTLYYLNNEHLKVSNSIARTILCLPMYDSLDNKTQYKIIKLVLECLT